MNSNQPILIIHKEQAKFLLNQPLIEILVFPSSLKCSIIACIVIQSAQRCSETLFPLAPRRLYWVHPGTYVMSSLNAFPQGINYYYFLHYFINLLYTRLLTVCKYINQIRVEIFVRFLDIPCFQNCAWHRVGTQ